MAAPERPTALLVNDEPSQIRLISAVLEKAGIRTRCCAGVEEALASLHSDSDVDLIVTDLHMPGIDGWRFCQLLRSPDFAQFNRLPILVVSATFSGSDADIVADLRALRDLGVTAIDVEVEGPDADETLVNMRRFKDTIFAKV